MSRPVSHEIRVYSRFSRHSTPNTVFTRFGVYFQVQSETETIDFPVDLDMAAVRGVMRPGGEAVATMKAVTYTINSTHHLIATTQFVLRNKDPFYQEKSVSA